MDTDVAVSQLGRGTEWAVSHQPKGGMVAQGFRAVIESDNGLPRKSADPAKPLFGSAPMMTLAVNPTTNQVTSGGATYDAAGNLTYDGTTNYTFDEMNRMTQASGPYGTFGSSYSPGENKRMVVYGSSSNPQTLTMFLYAPNGKVLSQLAYQKNGSNWAPIAINALTNYLYLGGKALSYAENNVGSNGSGTYWPYGSTNTNPTNGPSTFATYSGDWSGLYYADQRYYDYNWGRFQRADPSDQNIDPSVSGSYNRYAYVNGDPANGADPSGLDGSGPGYGCQYNASSTMLYCSSAVPPGTVDPSAGVGITIDPNGTSVTVTATAVPVPEAPAYLANDGGPTDPTAASQGQSAPTGTAPTLACSPSGCIIPGGPPLLTKKEIITFLCKNSPQNRVIASMEFGFLNGAARGGYIGFSGGIFFEGMGAIPGAILGGLAGGVAGAAGGAIKGGAYAGACSLAGVY